MSKRPAPGVTWQTKDMSGSYEGRDSVKGPGQCVIVQPKASQWQLITSNKYAILAEKRLTTNTVKAHISTLMREEKIPQDKKLYVEISYVILLNIC